MVSKNHGSSDVAVWGPATRCGRAEPPFAMADLCASSFRARARVSHVVAVATLDAVAVTCFSAAAMYRSH